MSLNFPISLPIEIPIVYRREGSYKSSSKSNNNWELLDNDKIEAVNKKRNCIEP